MRESEQPRGTLLASGTVVAFHLEAVSGRILGASSAAEAFYGYTKGELCQMTLSDLPVRLATGPTRPATQQRRW